MGREGVVESIPHLCVSACVRACVRASARAHARTTTQHTLAPASRECRKYWANVPLPVPALSFRRFSVDELLLEGGLGVGAEARRRGGQWWG